MRDIIDIKMYEGSIAPIVTATPDATGVMITIIDKDGTHTAHVNNGINGINGQDGAKGDTGPQGPIGPQGPTGKAFMIAKTYSSYQAMQDDFNNMHEGDFVMIVNNVETEDNAKLYCRSAVQWVFIVDLSGQQGIQGPQGPMGPQGPSGSTGRGIVSVVAITDGRLIFTFTDGTTQTIYPHYLPDVTPADVGKVLMVNAQGKWVAGNIQ